MTTLVIIRGNSGSGKTTLARQLHHVLTDSLLISQDIVRREMLNVKDEVGNLSISLIKNLLEFGNQQEQFVILEGILKSSVYGPMMREQIQDFDQVVTVYYRLSLNETVRRHYTKPITEFTAIDLTRWYQSDDSLHIEGEMIFDESVSLLMAEKQILTKINEY
ncbi:kinase [Leuconostoc koreense]|nr:kinase [Leuconostoc mesenteroides]QGM25414.1 AAA family ATPase [Leuconostoc mesenteroides subsp. mesenteroides]